jgi:hypothetical protein
LLLSFFRWSVTIRLAMDLRIHSEPLTSQCRSLYHAAIPQKW